MRLSLATVFLLPLALAGPAQPPTSQLGDIRWEPDQTVKPWHNCTFGVSRLSAFTAPEYPTPIWQCAVEAAVFKYGFKSASKLYTTPEMAVKFAAVEGNQ